MITVKNNVFRIDTGNTTYIFRITKYGHLEHVYYGTRLDEKDMPEALAQKQTAVIGTSIAYDGSDDLYSLDNMCLEWSDNGRGDFRQSPTELKMPDGTFVSDFIYEAYSIFEDSVPMKTLPTAYGGKTLEITMRDISCSVRIKLYYTVYDKANVITRRAVLINEAESELIIRRIMSMLVDLPDEGFSMYTLDGGWIKEAHIHERPVQYGITVNSSTTGASSNRHNPGFMLAAAGSSEDNGNVYGFNLIYSGNHCSAVEKNGRDFVRVTTGINPHCFEWRLEKGESFETPEAVMTFSPHGFNGMSRNMHRFVNDHIVRGDWKNRERPVLFNNWEGTFFDFNEGKLMQLAKDAKELGAELFVLDDGWFGERDNDKAGLGDYYINQKKFPKGLKHFADKVKDLGLKFGLWFEPEMVNPDSTLYRTHPEFSVRHPDKKPVFGRNQLVLDLCNEAVRNYIVENVGAILDECGIDYVKWDMNRSIAEGYSPTLADQGEFYHRYIMGLYDVLSRIFGPRPHILVESCSSGGNRFDLGMLCFSQQIWCSDDTDPVERLKIQGGLSYMYPLSAMGAHVSQSPSQQTLRETALSTRFNTACFGCLGYELDLKYLSREEKKDIKEQIVFYKKHRRLFQYGTFSRIETGKYNKTAWQCVGENGDSAAVGLFQTVFEAAQSNDRLRVTGLNDGMYSVETRPQRLYIERFGSLVKHLLPIELSPDGIVLRTVNRHYSMKDCVERYICSSNALDAGIPLCSQFMGSGYNEKIRMLGDFGSNIYIIQKTDSEGNDHD